MEVTMSLNEKEAVIKEYFEMWVLRDFKNIDNIFYSDIYYSECYGPEYQGISEIHQWIDKMLKEQVVFEWFFKHKMQDEISGFDGVSIIEFTENGTINSIKEFASEAIHTTPFR
jgi:hypothetical protein